MLFLTRACLCIGTIVVLAERVDLGDLASVPRDAAGSLAASAARPIEAFCRERPADCIAAVKAAVQAEAGPPPAVVPAAPTRKPKHPPSQRSPDRHTGSDRPL